MTTRHPTELLPLWIEGDLDGPEAQALETHLQDCPGCRATAEALRESQAWLKSSPPAPFGEEDYQAIRSRVMAKIQTKARPVRPLRWALLPLAAGFALVVFRLGWGTSSMGVPAPVQAVEVAPATSMPRSTASAVSPAASPRPARALARFTRPAGAMKPALEAAPAAYTRIEYQTSDPTIRIIWLTSSAESRALPTL